MTTYERIFNERKGMVNLGRNLGLVVAPLKTETTHFNSWLFIPSEDIGTSVKSVGDIRKLVNEYKVAVGLA